MKSVRFGCPFTLDKNFRIRTDLDCLCKWCFTNAILSIYEVHWVNARMKSYNKYYKDLLTQFINESVDSRAGWLDCDNFRLWGDYFTLRSFFKITKVASTYFWASFYKSGSYYFLFWQKRIGLDFGPFFYKRICSPWPRAFRCWEASIFWSSS
jgi:hypothetical protein